MNKLSLVAVGIIVLSAVLLFSYNDTTTNKKDIHAQVLFEEWKNQFNKNYHRQGQEQYRFKIFYQNMLLVNQQNQKFKARQTVTQVKLNQFSDLLVQEFLEMYTSKNVQAVQNFACDGPQAPTPSKLEANFTLDSKMINPKVGNQGQCASGYAFATIGAVESSYYKIFKTITPFSSQLLVDCSQQIGNVGCTSGSPINSLQYLINKGAMKDSDYPYIGKSQTCAYNSAKKVWQVDSCTKVNSTNTTALQGAIFQQPVIVQFDPSDPKFIQLGGTGIYQAASDKVCGTKISHYMLAVGWGQYQVKSTFSSTTYYYILVKNSFGTAWGSNGYAKIVYKTSKNTVNSCGLFGASYFPYE